MLARAFSRQGVGASESFDPPRPGANASWREEMRAFRLALIAGSAAAATACATILPRGLTAEAPVPAAPELVANLPLPPPSSAPQPSIPEQFFADGGALTVADVVEVALRNNPLTRASYFQALAARAQLGIDRAAYYPQLDLNAYAARTKQSALGGQFDYQLTSYGPELALSYLVLDLGGRAADAEAARLALLAADWTHTSVVQDVILGVQQTYVEYLNARAQLAAARTALTQAQTALEAATGRRDAGVATIADVLQARTAMSQEQLAVDRLSGQVLALRGALATAMGLPATTPYDVGELPTELPLDFASKTVEELIEQAQAARPDLAAVRLQAERAGVRIRSARADGLPSLLATADANRTYFDPSTFASYGDNWSARLALRIPLFTGFETKYKVQQAKDEAAAAAAQAATLEQQVILQVWTSYYGLQTATQLVKTSRDLLASAEQSERVALGRYREGVGTIIDLLAAQSALADARAEEILARSSWFYALAQLARDVGVASPALKTAVSVTREDVP
jgi:outer membrane protein TolC